MLIQILAWITILVFFLLLIIITYIDIRTMKIPDRLNGAVFLLGMISIVTLPGPSLANRVIGVFSISVPMLLVTFLFQGGFGGGDIKLMAVSGLIMGWQGNVKAMSIAVFLGGIWGLILLWRKKVGRKEAFAFGPCLCGGLAVSFISLYIC